MGFTDLSKVKDNKDVGMPKSQTSPFFIVVSLLFDCGVGLSENPKKLLWIGTGAL